MMPDATIAEMILYSTVKLVAMKKNVPVSSGTGFFMNMASGENKSVPTIVTNNHVLENCDAIMVICHLAENEKPSGKFVPCTIHVSQGSFVRHPNPKIDLCAIFFAGILNQASSAGTPLFCQFMGVSNIPKDDDWEYFDAIEEVTMVGCPNGISDEFNNLPITRRGITASAISKDYNGKQEFMVDMACFPGSSGSPVFIFDRNGYLDRRENIFKMGQSRIFLVGVLYSGPQITNSGQIILAQPPKVQVAAMMHLGNVIRASAIRELDDAINKMIGNSLQQKT